MKRNEIIKAYGTDFKNLTKKVISRGGLLEEIQRKWEGLDSKKDLSEIRIAIKPNLMSPTPAIYGATTHPEIVDGIIEYLQENGFMNITIMEGSWVGDKTSEAFEYCGYNELAKRKNVKIVDTQKDGFSQVSCAGMDINICNCVKEIDFMINVPVLKGHCQTKITCALKNMKGLIPNSEKRLFHAKGLHKPIATLNKAIKQDFIVIDHICGDLDFEDGGNPVVRNCIMAALDPVLVDAYVCKLLGYKVDEVEYVTLAEALKIGSTDIENANIVTIEGDDTEDIVRPSRIMEISYDVEEVESCSACYESLMEALDQLEKEGLLSKLNEKIGIGQGYKGKTGKLGVGDCTKGFEINVPGCPPKAKDIYDVLKNTINGI